MPVEAFRSIRDRVREVTRDYAGARWSDDELDTYINYGQSVFCRRTRTLEKSLDIYYQNAPLFGLQNDYIDAIRFELAGSGRCLCFVSWTILAEQYGPQFLSHKGSDLYYLYFDYDNWRQFRFYPNPDVPEGAFLGTLHYYRLPMKDVLEVDDVDALVQYVLFSCYIKESDKGMKAKAARYYDAFMKRIPENKKPVSEVLRRRSVGRVF